MADPVTWMYIGTAVAATTTVAAAERQEDAAHAEAHQMRKNADAEFAEGTRAAAEYFRQGRLLESNMRAQMAGQGGITTDPGATEMLGEVGRVSNYNALSALYSSEQRAEGLRMAAQNKKRSGRNARDAGYMKALGTAISGGVNASTYKG